MTAAVEAHAVRERPIILRDFEARGLADGSISVLWREVKSPARNMQTAGLEVIKLFLSLCPFGAPGERLWGREAWSYFGGEEYVYQQDRQCVRCRDEIMPYDPIPGGRWRSPVAMPRWACRTVLEIVSVGVQRPQDASEGVANASLPPLAAEPRRQAGADLVATLVEHGIASTTWCWTLTVRRLP